MTSPSGSAPRWPRSRRVRKSIDFRRIQRRSATWKGRLIVALHDVADQSEPRVGLVVSRKVGNAVVRNRVKRWLRESVRRRLEALTGVELVLIARPRAASAGFARIDEEVSHALSAIGQATTGAD